MMDVRTRFMTSAAVTQIVPLDDARILEQAHGTINGRNRDSVIDPDAATVELFDIRMIVRLCEDTCDDAALLGHAHSFGGAQRLDVLFLGDIPACGAHGASLTSVRPGIYGLPIILAVSGMCLSGHKRSRRNTSASAAFSPSPE